MSSTNTTTAVLTENADTTVANSLMNLKPKFLDERLSIYHASDNSTTFKRNLYKTKRISQPVEPDLPTQKDQNLTHKTFIKTSDTAQTRNMYDNQPISSV